MLWTNIKRVSRLGFLNFWRNGSVSLASVLIMTVTLLVGAGLILSQALLGSTLNEIRNKVDINVYFVTTADEAEILALQNRLKDIPEVLETKYTSRDEELVKFKERHKDDALTLQALDEVGENPLGASLEIKAKEPSQYESIATLLENEKANDSSSVIDKINYNRNKVAIEALSRIITASRKLGSAVALFFIGVAILITFNTIRLTIYMAREEISVMRLVGASTRYIKGPFIVSGIMNSIISTVLAAIILLPITYWAGPYTYSLGTGLNLFGYYLSNMPSIIGMIFISSLVIGALSSYLAVKKYLKV